MARCEHGFDGVEVSAYWDESTILGIRVEDESHADVFGSFFCSFS